MRNFLKKLDDNIIACLAGFLLIFIPLYPKLPLFDILPGYIVRVRLEDLFIALTLFVWLVWLLRGKIRLGENPLFLPILIYLGVGFLSMVSAVFVIGSVPLEGLHINKMFLHYLRRIEYFSLFFIFYSTVRSLRLVKIYLGILIATIIAVSIYGFGQKYLYWPAFSTMNREFSKGWMLYLTEHARVLSTFGGHYDLAAFIMMVLVLLWSLFFGVKGWLWKVFIFMVIACAFWTLILTASRTSFIAYLFGLTALFFLWAFKKGIRWSAKRWLIVTFFSIFVMLSFGDLSERFTKFLRINERFGGIKSLLLSPIGAPPSDRAIFLANNPNDALALITAKSDQPPRPVRPIDVYQDIPLVIPEASGTSVSSVSRTYSRTAFLFDLSTAIRFDALWPMAIAGFKRNPILGSGYSTLNRTQPTQFTEAESTDNDYLRSLGETGLLGFVAFFGTLALLLFLIWRNLSIIRDPVLFSVSVGLGGLLFGLLVNALYIDVFESSKVAFSFWAIAGFVLAGINIHRRDKVSPPPPRIADFGDVVSSFRQKISHFSRSDVFFVLVILILAFGVRLYKINTPLADWHSWRQADTSAVTRNYVKHGINILYPTYDDLSNIASGRDNLKGLRLVEFPLYNMVGVFIDKLFVGYTIEVSQRLTSIFASLGSIVFLFFIVKKYIGRKEAVFASTLFAILPYNIFYNRVILPEPFLVFITLGMIYFFDKWISSCHSEESLDKLETASSEAYLLRHFVSRFLTSFGMKKVFYFLMAFLFTASALLIKPFAAFLFLPMVYLWFKNFGYSLKSLLGLLGYWVICLLPFLWWRWWMSHYPEGIPANMWLLNGDGIRFKGAFFYWLFAERLAKLILGYWGLPLLLLGIISRSKKEGPFFYWWGTSMLLYVTVVATGNVRHDYYQIITIPIITIFMAKGIVFLLTLKGASRFLVLGSLFSVLLFSEMFGWYHIRDFYNINHPEIVEAGSAVQRLTPSRSLVVAPYNGDTAFLYQTGRAGWPIMQENVDKMIQKGAHFYVSVNFDELTNNLIKEAILKDELKRRFKLIEKTDRYVIIQLVPDKQLPK